MDTEVLIVGAGPTGLMLANQLARRGVRSLIIERHAGPAMQTRALGVQARTLEIYAHLGVVDRALALGKQGDGAQLWSQGRRIGHVPLIDAGSQLTPYPYILVLGQDDNEKILGDHLRALGQDVQWNTELVALEQQADHVTAALALADGSTRQITAAWVAGCDGGRSKVRELNGITFPGAPYEHVFYVADVQLRGKLVPDQVNVCLWKEGFHLFFPMRGQDHWRIVGIVPPELRDRDDLDFAEVTPSLSDKTGLRLAIQQCTWFSTYRIHHRAAARFRNGRCFLLGDAAHVHSPVGAQGMNTGLQDAYNLAWKLSLVITHQANEALLETYAAERMPVARRLLATTDRGFRLVVSDSWWAGLMRTRVLARIAAFAMRRKAVQALAFRTVSQIGIHYRGSDLSLAVTPMPATAPKPGDRFPWMHLSLQAEAPARDLFQSLPDTCFHLLVFGQQAPTSIAPAWNGLLQVHAVPATDQNQRECERAGIPVPSFFLLRPDGHVGLCGDHWEAVDLAVYADRLGLRRRIG